MSERTPAEAIKRLSTWLDGSQSYVGADPEAVMWRRCAKVGEEHGEVIAALIGALGENPRKGVTHTMADVVEELLDVAVTALGAVEHITGNSGQAWTLLGQKAVSVADRVRLWDE